MVIRLIGISTNIIQIEFVFQFFKYFFSPKELGFVLETATVQILFFSQNFYYFYIGGRIKFQNPPVKFQNSNF
jgi:hypothetical protein